MKGFLFFLSLWLTVVSTFAQRTPLKVNGTVVNNPNLTNSATVTYTVNGANVTATAAGSSGTVGTVINIGASGVGNVPAYTDATGTNVAPFTALTLSGTNASLVGVLTANGVNATNFLRLNGVDVLTTSAGSGFVKNTGTPAIGNVPTYSDTTGTNIAPASALTITGTNAALTGVLTANGGNFTNFLRLNGTDVSTAAAANPTATIGLTAVNGSASTFLRSDGAPALPSTGGAYHGAVLTPWVDTNNAVSLMWRKAPQVCELYNAASADFATIAVNSGSVGIPGSVPDSADQGVFSLTTGTLTNGIGGVRFSSGAIATLPTNSFAVMWRVRVPTSLSSDTDGYELQAGLLGTFTDAAQANGVFFYYTHSTSNGVWTAKTVAASAVSFATGAPTTPPTVTASVWYNLLLVCDNNSSDFWVSSNDGQTWQWIGATASNIPTSSISPAAILRKVGPNPGGTTSRTAFLGRLEIWPALAN